MSYQVLLDPDQAQPFYAGLDEKSQRIVRENLKALADDPYPRPGAGTGDREKITFEGRDVYRLHIGRTYTAIYDVFETKGEVRVYRILPIDEAHKRYGY